MRLPNLSLLALLAAIPGVAQNARELTVTAAVAWTDTNLDLSPGDTVLITAKGTLNYADGKSTGPEGLPRSWTDLIRQLPVNDAGRGALVGRIGSSNAARPFLVGTSARRVAPIAGRLFLGINKMSNEQPEGAYTVTIERTVTARAAPEVREADLPPFPQSLIDQVPVRVTDPDGTPGDRVNFFLIGSEQKVQNALRAAGWVTVDRTNRDAVIRGIFSSLSRQAYVTLPMSTLTLFGRGQDYGYAQGDPVHVVAARHHFRLWKAPFTLGGQTVWAGAGTHDVGFDRDQRNNGITHKIDPDTDKEREYIGESLKQTGMVLKTMYVQSSEPVTRARTAHGQEFFSDGRALVIYLEGKSSGNLAQSFGDLFCSVLKQVNPDGGEWDSCETYIDGGGKTDLQLAPLPKTYRVAVVPGLMSSCFADSPAFDEGRKALTDRYGIPTELISVPNDPSEENAKTIARALREKWGSDRRKFIVVGYSKGAPDLQVALAEEGIGPMVAAAVTVAGAVGGSPIADALPAAADRWIRQYGLPGCKGDLAAGFKSLRRAARQAFLAAHPNIGVPAYSIVAKSGRDNTSKSLLQTWQLLTSYGPAQDGQLLREDAIFPDSKFLGTAIADHFAVALPFEKAKDPAIKSGMDKNRYPRAALLEAVVRFVVQDLEGASGGTSSTTASAISPR